MEAIKNVLDDHTLGEKMTYEITNGEFLTLMTHVSRLGYILATLMDYPTALFKEKNIAIIDRLLIHCVTNLEGIMPSFLESLKEKTTEEQKATLDEKATNELKEALSAANTTKH